LKYNKTKMHEKIVKTLSLLNEIRRNGKLNRNKLTTFSLFLRTNKTTSNAKKISHISKLASACIEKANARLTANKKNFALKKVITPIRNILKNLN
jgi:hypothetical protein